MYNVAYFGTPCHRCTSVNCQAVPRAFVLIVTADKIVSYLSGRGRMCTAASWRVAQTNQHSNYVSFIFVLLYLRMHNFIEE